MSTKLILCFFALIVVSNIFTGAAAAPPKKPAKIPVGGGDVDIVLKGSLVTPPATDSETEIADETSGLKSGIQNSIIINNSRVTQNQFGGLSFNGPPEDGRPSPTESP